MLKKVLNNNLHRRGLKNIKRYSGTNTNDVIKPMMFKVLENGKEVQEYEAMDFDKANIIIAKMDSLIISYHHKVWFAEQIKEHSFPLNVSFKFSPKSGKKTSYYLTFKCYYDYNKQALSIDYDQKLYNLIVRKFDALIQGRIKVFSPKSFNKNE